MKRVPRPERLIEQKRSEDRQEREKARQDFREARDQIQGNPQVVAALAALEARIGQLEDEIL